MLTNAQVIERAEQCQMVPIEMVDRDAFAVALFLQGYRAQDATYKAYVDLSDNDGALQLLARHRIAATAA